MTGDGLGADGGWSSSAAEYIRLIDAGDRNRTHVLDPAMLSECGDVAGQLVLDLGSGEGRFSRMLAERGAKPVGVDIARELVEAAHDRDGGGAEFVQGSATALPFRTGSFDLVVSYVMLIDVADYTAAIADAVRVLKAGGRLVVANLGFVSAAAGWVRDGEGHKLHFPIDRYAEERSYVVGAAGLRVRNWHRPLSAYMRAYLSQGLVLQQFVEPLPAEALRDDPGFEDDFRVPHFNVMRWAKP